jgi:hypothetical protein
VELTVAGPALVPADGAASTPMTSPVDEPVAGGLGATTDDSPPLAGAPSFTTTTEVHRPVAAVTEPVIEPAPRTVPASVPPADDPVVRSTITTLAPPATVPSGSATVTTTTLVRAEPKSEGPLCLPSDIRLTVATDKSTYATGETVTVMATVEKRTATACRMSQVHVRVDNSAGQNVVPFPYIIEIGMPDTAQPGMTFTGSYIWDQRDCVNASCAQVPAGTYSVYGEAPISDRVSFQVGA